MFSRRTATAEGRRGRRPSQLPPRSGHSIALRLTLGYALFTFGLVFAVAALLYWTLVNGLYEEDVRDLADNLNNARLLLRTAPGRWTPQPVDPRPAWAPPQQPQIYLRVLSAEGRTVTETPGMSRELPPPDRAELAAVRGPDGEKREILSHSHEPFLSLIVRVPGREARDPPLYLQVAMDREHDEFLLARYRERLWLLFGASLILCSAAGYFIARGGMRPIAKISRAAAHIGSATLHERIDIRGLPAELGGLADTFNGMLDRLEESFRHVSQFSDDVAHELRTPINNLRGEIEVALGKSRSGEAYRETLSSCLEECARVSRLIEALLFLARSDTSTQALPREEIDLGHELSTVEAFYGAAAADAGVALRIDCSGSLSARVNRALLQQAIGNLVSNALDHTAPGGSVTVGARAQAGTLALTVRDTGCGIPREHLPRVFERFYRVDRARARSAQHVGLGLAVVKSIAARHGGQVEIDSEVGRGTEVRLILPA